MSNISHSHSLSSTFAVSTLAIALIGLILLPDGFSVYPASLKTLVFFACSVFICAYFLVTTFRRKKLYLNLSPLTLPLVIFAFFLLISILINNPLHATKSFLGLGGVLMAFCVLAICSSILIKINNSQIAIKTVLAVVTASALASIIVAINTFTHILPENIASALYSPGLNLGLMFIGLAAIGANFFKKNKFKTLHLVFLPVCIIGLVTSLYLDFQAAPATPSFFASLSASIHQLTENEHMDYKTLFLGSKSQIYADIYDHYSGDTDTSHLGVFFQSYSAPLTLLSLYGLLATITWLILIGQTTFLCFRQEENNRDLYFILLVSFFVQLFTAIYPLTLMIQAILIAFATNKNRQILINLNLATISSEKNTQKVENRDNIRILITSFSTISSILLIIFVYNLVRNYQGFHFHEKSLDSILEDNLTDYVDYAHRAVRIAPNIDIFNRDAAIANIELMVNNINKEDSDTNQTGQYYNTAVEYAQKAIDIEPTHATNHFLYAQILQDAYPYLESEADLTKQASDINSEYGQAMLYQPTNPDYKLSIGGFYQSVGNYETALTYYQDALKLNNDSAQAHYQLATLYEAQGDEESALTSYRNTLQLLEADSDDYATVQAKISTLE